MNGHLLKDFCEPSSKKGFRDISLDLAETEITGIWNEMSKGLLKHFYEEADCSKYPKDHKGFSDAKIIIVGTITPHDAKEFFYTAQKTKMYEIVDKLLNTNLDEKKKKGEIDVKNGLIDQLDAERIFFLDVFSKVIRKKKSASDEDILFGSLNYDGFKKYMPQIGENTVIVANSQLAHDLCKKILNRINDGKNSERLEKEPHSIFRREKVETMTDDWEPIFKKAGFTIKRKKSAL